MCVQVGVCVCVCVRVWVSIWVQYFGNYFALLVVVAVVTLTPLWTPALKFGGDGLSFYLSWEYELPFADIWQIDIFIFATQYFFSCFVNFGAFSLPPTCPEYSSKWKFAGTFCPAAGEKTKKIRWKFEKGFVSFLFPISFFFCCSWPLSFVRVSITPFGPLAPSAPLAPPALGAPFAPLGHSFQFHFFASVLVNGFHAGAISCCCLKSVEWKRLEPIMP